MLGGCGFIGSHLVDALLKAGHQVRVLDHSREKFRKPLNGVEYRIAELSDSVALGSAVLGMDIVFHTVSTSVPETSNRDPEADIRGNLINMLHLLDHMRTHEVKRIVYLSSGGTVYGNTDVTPTPETQLLNPVCSYGIVKLAIEKYLFMYQQLYGLQPVVIRPANPYGPRQNPTGIQGAISSFMSRIMHHQPVQIWGDGSIVRDFFHVEDLARLCLLAGESTHTGIFNAGSGTGCSIRSLLDII
ncbi:MAG: NAD-dependent epimerase, partial [Zetaproteobacteria bacterium CG_4_8_14_3_um_filter_59_5]